MEVIIYFLLSSFHHYGMGQFFYEENEKTATLFISEYQVTKLILKFSLVPIGLKKFIQVFKVFGILGLAL